MLSLKDKIMRRVRGYGRGKWVCTAKDFLGLGSRAAVDQALSRLAKNGELRRVGRGLYDLPRISAILKRPVPVNIDAAVAALARRDGVRVMPDGIVAASGLGLTNAVPAKAAYVTDGATRVIKIGGRSVYLRHAGSRHMSWHRRPGAPVAQALDWLGMQVASDPKTIDALSARLSPQIKRDLRDGVGLLPSWATSIVHKVASS